MAGVSGGGAILTHHSEVDAEHIAIESRDQGGLTRDKPNGFWVSDDADLGWRQWCSENEWTCSPYPYRVELDDTAEILWLTTRADLMAFTELFGEPDPYILGQWSMRVDWPRVANHWQGIFITPYQWSARLTLSWYYGWDCASGCIWDAAAVRAVTRMVEVH